MYTLPSIKSQFWLLGKKSSNNNSNNNNDNNGEHISEITDWQLTLYIEIHGSFLRCATSITAALSTGLHILRIALKTHHRIIV